MPLRHMHAGTIRGAQSCDGAMEGWSPTRSSGTSRIVGHGCARALASLCLCMSRTWCPCSRARCIEKVCYATCMPPPLETPQNGPRH